MRSQRHEAANAARSCLCKKCCATVKCRTSTVPPVFRYLTFNVSASACAYACACACACGAATKPSRVQREKHIAIAAQTSKIGTT